MTESIPAALRDVFDEIRLITDAFCAEHLDDEYAQLCHRMAAKLARKRPSPLLRGQRLIMDTLRIGQFDPEWSRQEIIDRSPLTWLIQVDGLLLDARRLPREIQVEAFELGLIPYVPA